MKIKIAVICLFLTMSPLKIHSTAPSILSPMSKTDLKCMMDNIYHEARSEPLAGQVAVAKVVLNRSTGTGGICRTIYAKYQFSWTAKVKPIKDYKAYYTAFQAANLAFYTNFPATHYHAVSVRPGWSKRLQKVAIIDNHIFYK
jgi:spore germination cell wall hydrolase CwlJ-like protein